MTSSAPDRLVGNAGALVVGRLAVAAFAWAGTLLIVRTLQAEEFGRFALLFGVLGMLSIVTDMGIGRAAVAGVLGNPDGAGPFVGSYVVLRSLLGVVGYGVAVGFVVLGRYPAEVVEAMAVAALVVVFSTPAHALGIVFQAQLRLRTVAVAGAVAQGAQLALTAAIAATGGSVLWFVVPAVVGETINLTIVAARAHRLIPIRYRPDVRQWSVLLREAVPLSVGAAFATLTYRIDTVMLSQLDTFRAVGHYNVASKLPDLVRFGSTAVSTPMLTILVSSFPDQPEAFRTALRRAASLLSALGVGAFVGTALYATEIIGLLYGREYVDADRATVVLMAAQTVAFGTSMAFTVLAATAQHRVYPFVAGGGLLTNVAVNTVAIPHWSFQGAAAATLLTEVVVLIPLALLVRRIPHVQPFPAPSLGPLAMTGVLTFGLGAALAATPLPWAAAAVLTGVFFTVVARCSGALDVDDLRGRR